MFPQLVRSRPDFALDLGTRNYLISDRKSILFRDQCLAARRRRPGTSKSPLLTGQIAAEVYERDPGNFELIKPIARGVVSDFKNCGRLLEGALRDLQPRFRGFHLLVTAPLDVTGVEREAFNRVCLVSGASKVTLVAEPTAAALGMVPGFFDQKGILMVDVGAGITEVVLYSLGGVVAHASVRIGGDDFEDEMIRFFQRKYQFRIGRRTASELLLKFAIERNEIFLRPLKVSGLDLRRSLPATISVEAMDLDPVLDSLFESILRTVEKVLRVAPEELSSDIMDRGIHLSGGASHFPRLQDLLSERTGLLINLDRQPLLGVARGEIELLQNPDMLKVLALAV